MKWGNPRRDWKGIGNGVKNATNGGVAESITYGPKKH